MDNQVRSSKVTDNQTQVGPAADDTTDPLVSDELLNIFLWMNFAVICQLIDVFGTAANIINIICFVKQGFTDPVNVSLLGLAISDLGCLLTLVWTNICFTPAFGQLDLPFEPVQFQHMTGSWPHAFFMRVSSWITASITLERCLCVTMPLQVKSLITPKRVALINVLIFAFILASIVPVYYVSRLGMTFFLARNRTLIGLIFIENRQEIEQISLPLSNVIIPLGAFFVVIVLTAILVFNLKMQSRWRNQSSGSKGTDRPSNRDQKVAKMVVAVSSFFIASNVPMCTMIMSVVSIPNFSVDGIYLNTLLVFCSFGYILDSANAAVNIFIYYHMSSKFRAVFQEIILHRK